MQTANALVSLHFCSSLPESLLNNATDTINPDILARTLFSANSVKDIFVAFKNAHKAHDLPILVNDIVISAYCEDFIFTKLCMKFHENKTSRKFQNLQYLILICWLKYKTFRGSMNYRRLITNV